MSYEDEHLPATDPQEKSPQGKGWAGAAGTSHFPPGLRLLQVHPGRACLPDMSIGWETGGPVNAQFALSSAGLCVTECVGACRRQASSVPISGQCGRMFPPAPLGYLLIPCPGLPTAKAEALLRS